MPPILPTIAAHVVGTLPVRPAEDKGVVTRQVSETGFILRFRDGEQLEVQVPAGALREGDVVRVRAEGDTLILQKIDGMRDAVPRAPGADTYASPEPDPAAVRRQLSAILAGLVSDSLPPRTDEAVRQIADLLTKDAAAPVKVLNENETAALQRVVAALRQLTVDPASLHEMRNTVQETLRILVPLRPPPSTVTVTLPAAALQPGLYSFDSGTAATSLLAQNGAIIGPEARSMLNGLTSCIAEARTTPQGLAVTIASANNAGPTVETYLREFLASENWRSLPKEVMTEILADRGSLPLPRLLLADALLLARTMQSPGQPEAPISLGQWARLVLDTSVPVSIAAAQDPTAAATDLVAGYEQVRRMGTQAGIPVAGPMTEAAALDPAAAPPSAKTIMEIPRAMGVTLEHDLLAIAEGSREGDPVATIKGALLALQKSLPAVSPEATASPLLLGGRTPDSAPAPLRIVAAVLPAVDAAVALVAELEQTIVSTRRSDLLPIRAEVPVTVPARTEPGQPAVAAPPHATEAAPPGAEPARPVKSIALLLARLLNEIPAEERPPALMRQAERAIAVRQTVAEQSVGPPRPQPATPPVAEGAAPPVPGTTVASRPELVQAIARALEDLLQIVRRVAQDAQSTLPPETAAKAETAERSVSRHLGRLIAELQAENSPASRPGAQTPAEVLRQSVENALGRLESLQVLARPAPAGDATHQVIAVPLKIHGEWTEVKMRFVKQRRGTGEGGAAPRYTVALQVAPSLLGEVTTSMEYFPRKNFRVRMDFERDGACSWFEKNRAALAESFQALGLPSPVIELGRLRPRRARGAPRPSGVIDVKA